MKNSGKVLQGVTEQEKFDLLQIRLNSNNFCHYPTEREKEVLQAIKEDIKKLKIYSNI